MGPRVSADAPKNDKGPKPGEPGYKDPEKEGEDKDPEGPLGKFRTFTGVEKFFKGVENAGESLYKLAPDDSRGITDLLIHKPVGWALENSAKALGYGPLGLFTDMMNTVIDWNENPRMRRHLLEFIALGGATAAGITVGAGLPVFAAVLGAELLLNPNQGATGTRMPTAAALLGGALGVATGPAGLAAGAVIGSGMGLASNRIFRSYRSIKGPGGAEINPYYKKRTNKEALESDRRKELAEQRKILNYIRTHPTP